MNEVLDNQLISAFISEKVNEIRWISTGHINKSFLVRGDDTYILQEINEHLYRDFQDILTFNYLSYRDACCNFNEGSSDPFEYPNWLTDKEGSYFHRDVFGNLCRMYRYIPSDEINDEKADRYEIGRGLGKLHSILRTCKDIKNIKTTAHLHDLSHHYREYLDQNDNETERIGEIDTRIKDDIDKYLEMTVTGGSIIHGDAKIGNMIIRNGKVAGFIDLDTIMTGSVFDDIADCVRSCCLNDEGNIENTEFMDLIRGYEETSGTLFTLSQKDLIRKNIEKNRFLLGLRYYTDYLSGSGYFSEEYPGQTLKKARKLLLS